MLLMQNLQENKNNNSASDAKPAIRKRKNDSTSDAKRPVGKNQKNNYHTTTVTAASTSKCQLYSSHLSPCVSVVSLNATSAILTPSFNFASPTQIATSAIPASLPPPTQSIPPTNESPQIEERRDVLSGISHQLGCNDSDCNRSTQSVHKLLRSENEDQINCRDLQHQ
eukprot:15365834-Ditylum_brightwellii.AAC.1